MALVITWQMSAYPQLNTVLSRKKVAWLPRLPHLLMMKGALQAGIWDRGHEEGISFSSFLSVLPPPKLPVCVT